VAQFLKTPKHAGSMGFAKPDIQPAYSAIRKFLVEIHSPYNDGFTTSYCKKDLYLLKCWLEDEYKKLPTYAGEEKWEQERIVQILKQ
jgi:hypothetical protein